MPHMKVTFGHTDKDGRRRRVGDVVHVDSDEFATRIKDGFGAVADAPKPKPRPAPKPAPEKPPRSFGKDEPKKGGDGE